ncbi:MAG TPA: hypothetical protein VIM03_06065, partial [Thermoleophilaceae bacterium]
MSKGVTKPSNASGRAGFLSDVIVELGMVDAPTVEQAVNAARVPGRTVARILVESGALTEDQLARATGERYGIDHLDLAEFDVDPAAANLITPSAAQRYNAVPVAFTEDGALLVAMADPADSLGINDIAVMTKLEVRPAVASLPDIEGLRSRLPLPAVPGAKAPPAPKTDESKAAAKEATASAPAKSNGGAEAAAPAAAPRPTEPERSGAVFW